MAVPILACFIHGAGRRKEKRSVGNEPQNAQAFRLENNIWSSASKAIPWEHGVMMESISEGRGGCPESFCRSSIFWWGERLAPPGACEDPGQHRGDKTTEKPPCFAGKMGHSCFIHRVPSSLAHAKLLPVPLALLLPAYQVPLKKHTLWFLDGCTQRI